MSVTLSARVIKKPRTYRECDECERPVFENRLQLYGMADIGDKPQTLTFHIDCYLNTFDVSQNKKVERALDAITNHIT